MPYKVFISYSTNDFSIVEYVRRLISSPDVDIFIAEYSVVPSEPLGSKILEAIKSCDMFVLLWSKNSKASEWVPQEIGVARGTDRIIIPVVLDEGLILPGFISDLKYLAAYQNPAESFLWLQQHINSYSAKQKQNNGLALIGISVALIWLLSQK
jgi:hypothetical protein